MKDITEQLLTACDRYTQNEQLIDKRKAQIAALKIEIDKLLEENEKVEIWLNSKFPERDPWAYNEHSITWNKSSGIVITDESLLPASCLRMKVEPNKKMIKTLLEDGKLVSGALIEERYNIQIK